MNEKMTMEEARRKKTILTGDILAAIYQFEKDTGLAVDALYLSHARDLGRGKVTFNVEAKVEFP